jgi:tRNA A37 threonylcarbamoyladenosine modification protein TsaB
MTLIIDISQQPSLILKNGRKIIAQHSWSGLYELSETLLIEIDKFLKRNKVGLKQLDKIKVKPSKQSLVSTRIAKAVALGLKA